MAVHLFALDYRRLPPAVRDRVSVPEAQTPALLRRITADAATDEAVVLLTCHRCELYTRTPDPDGMGARLRAVVAHGRPGTGAPDPAWREASGTETVLHLCRVACGLDSAVLGEAQILGQVRRAWAEALAAGTAGATLDRLFRLAIAAGKRARAIIGDERGPASVAEVALRLAGSYLGGWRGRRVLVIGSGTMGGVLARTLAAAGVASLVVGSRRPERAAGLAPGVRAVSLPQVPEVLEEVDAVVSATGAPGFVVDAAVVEAVMARRRRPLLLVDVAVPRDIDPRAREIAGVTLVDADEIISRAPHLVSRSSGTIARLEAIAARAAEAFARWERSRAAVPSIVRLRQRAEDIQRQELARALRRLPGLTERERAVVRAMAHGIVTRLLHVPTVRLQEAADRGDGAALRQVLDGLVALDREPE